MKCSHCNQRLAIYGDYCWECRESTLRSLHTHSRDRVRCNYAISDWEREDFLARYGCNYRKLICANARLDEKRSRHHVTA